MKINQLFKDKISDELLLQILNAFGLKSIDDETPFYKIDLENIGTLSKINELKDQLLQYYLPCKAKIYLENIDYSKCITVLRQVLKLFQIKLASKQKYVNYKKNTMYMIVKINDSINKCLKVDQHQHQLTFN
jgi:hypothetical protein